MIPTQLYIHNFLSYRGPVEIDFRGIDIACLSGDNGAGKSALLDAMTWALWGKARANSDRHLIALREESMEVVFSFMLNDAEYRVTRRRSLSGTSTLILILEMLVDGLWRPLSGDTARQTQAAIIDLLRLDYETFTNSAFILQGRAGEFTTRTPAQRKQVLANILRLEDYDAYERRARSELRKRENALRDIEGRLDEIDTQIRELPTREAELASCKQALAHLDTRLTTLREDHRQSSALLAEIDRVEAQITGLRAEQRAAESDAADARQALDDTSNAIANLDGALRDRETIEREHAEFERLRAQESADAATLSQRESLNDRHVQIQQEIRDRSRRIEDRILELNGRIAVRLGEAKRAAEIESRLERFASLSDEAERVERERDEYRTRADGTRVECAEIQTRNQTLRDEMNELRERIDQLSGTTARCPVCQQPLQPRERDRLRREAEAEGKKMADLYRRNQRDLKQRQRQIGDLDQKVAAADRRLQAIARESREQARIEEQFASAKRAAEEVATLREQVERERQSLESGDQTVELRATLQEIEDALSLLAYDRDTHQANQQRLAEIADAPIRYATLQRAETSMASLERERGTHQRALERAAASASSRAAEIAELERQLADRNAAETAEREARERLESAESERSALQLRLGALDHEVQRGRELQERRDEFVVERDILREESFDFDHLALAFGKRGLQAMIIENVAPELQDAANAILDRMPGNTMRVEFRTQRSALSRDAVIETLDIIISDSEGQRPYEVYSGGEAFRIDFAIRVALSTLLTRRAGARLELLVIDEGFGSQDTQGREGLLEAINAIQQDFKMIIVITHLSDLKDAFPTRIDVTKTLEGSMVSVSA